MTTSAVVAEEWRTRMAGATHVDATTRPQIVDKGHDPFLLELLGQVYEKTGIPSIINTSFNLGEPIVETPTDAARTFTQMPLTYCVMGDYLIEKV